MLILVFGGQYVDHHSLLRVKAHPSVLSSTVSTYYVLHTNLVLYYVFSHLYGQRTLFLDLT